MGRDWQGDGVRNKSNVLRNWSQLRFATDGVFSNQIKRHRISPSFPSLRGNRAIETASHNQSHSYLHSGLSGIARSRPEFTDPHSGLSAEDL